MLDRITALIHELGLSCKQVCDDLGLANSTFSDWKRGKAKPSLNAVVMLAEYLGVSIDYLVHGKEFSGAVVEFSNPSDESFLSKLHTLTPDLQSKLLSYMDGMIAAMPQGSDSEKRLSV